jgi:hypothetical protein
VRRGPTHVHGLLWVASFVDDLTVNEASQFGYIKNKESGGGPLFAMEFALPSTYRLRHGFSGCQHVSSHPALLASRPRCELAVVTYEPHTSWQTDDDAHAARGKCDLPHRTLY